MRPVICVWHSGCTDGFGSAYAVWLAYKDALCKPEFYPGVYNNAPPEVEGKDVILVDFSYSKAVLEDILTKAASVVIIDHHKSAIEALDGFVHPNLTKVFSTETSGAMATWNYYHKKEAPALLQHIQDRDLWQFKLPNTREIIASLYSQEFDFDLWHKFTQDWQQYGPKLFIEGEAIIRHQRKQINYLTQNFRYMHLAGHTVPVVNCAPELASDTCHELAKDQPFAASYIDGKVYRVFSLRSTKDVGMDVSEIAAQFFDLEGQHGGGHKHAAGFRVALKDLRDKYRALL